MPTSEANPSLATTFDLLGDKTRLRIVESLLEADPEPLRFSEIRSRVGARDPGRFNYHLNRLRGSLVEQRDEGYVLTREGRQFGSLLSEPTREGEPVGSGTE